MTEAAPSSAPVSLKALTLKRIAGVVPDQKFTLQNLPAGLVILHGPNGSGKSTTAKAIQELLWPESSKEFLDLHAQVGQGSEQWELDVHGKEVTALQGSTVVPHPYWAPSELRGRYSWSLNDLLRAEDADLAATLAAEMAGGIDFPELAKTMGWDKEPSAPQKKAREVKEADQQVRSLKSDQEALRSQSATLETLETQRAEAIQLRDRLPLLQAALELNIKQAELAEQKKALDRFSDGAKNILPGDATLISKALEKQQACTTELRDLERDRTETLANNPFSALTLEDETLERLQLTLEQTEHHWREAVRERQQAEETLAEAEVEEKSLRKRLGITNPESLDLQGYDLPDLRTWVETVLEVELSTLRLREAKKELARHPESPAMDSSLLQELRLDVRRLREHLEGTTRRGTPPFWIALAVLALLIALQIKAEELESIWAAIVPALAITPLTWAFLHRNSLTRRIESLLPEELTFTEVTTSTVRELQIRLDQMDREPELRRRWEEANQSLQQNTRILEALQERVVTLGIEPQPSREWCRNMLEDLQQWRQATDEVARMAALLSEREQRLDGLLTTFQSIWKDLGITPNEEDPVTEAMDVRRRLGKTLSNRQHLRHLDQQEADLLARQKDLDQELTDITGRLQLDSPNPARVEELASEHSRWDEIFRASEVLEQQVSDLRKRLELAPDLLELEAPALTSLESESRDAAKREEELRDQITRLTQQIELAQSGRNLHQAMEDRDAARAELIEERSRIAQQLAGRAILDWLQESCRIGDQPEALEEANRLLTRFTQGHLELTLDLTSEGHVFYASRPGEAPRGLEYLSTGERTQVLMAVRLAFLKRNERAPLPLLVDEVLGTSDDDRAEAIMQTLLQVVKDGRQIFYFTAQTDEVAKWKKQLAGEPSIPHTIIDLHALRTKNPSSPISIPPEAAPKSDPTRKLNESKADWAKRLGVPAWSGHDPIETVPLFLLMDQEEDALTACLTFGITTWGPLENLIESDSAGSLISEDLSQKLQARAAALEALSKAWRVGRPPAVDPATVLDSGIVTDAFTDEVLRVLKEVNYDASSFLTALENKAIQRWRQDNTDQLRSLFYEQGTLTDETPLSEEQMLSRALAGLKENEQFLELLTPADWQNVAQVFRPALHSLH